MTQDRFCRDGRQRELFQGHPERANNQESMQGSSGFFG